MSKKNKKYYTFSSVLADVIKKERIKQNFDQGKFAKLMGLSQASYSRLETGKAVYNANQFALACLILFCSPVTIIRRTLTRIDKLKADGFEPLPGHRKNANKNTKKVRYDKSNR